MSAIHSVMLTNFFEIRIMYSAELVVLVLFGALVDFTSGILLCSLVTPTTSCNVGQFLCICTFISL